LAVSWTRQAFGPWDLETPFSAPRIVRTRIVHVDQPAFQRFSTGPWSNILNQTGHGNIREERCVVRRPFKHIKKTVDPADRPKDRNPTLFRVTFLHDALSKLTAQRRPDRITGIIEEKP
jgi:hypothetical protein